MTLWIWYLLHQSVGKQGLWQSLSWIRKVYPQLEMTTTLLDKPPPLAQTLRTLNLSTPDNRSEPLEASVPVGHPVAVGKVATVSSGPPPNVLDVMAVLGRVMEDDVQAEIVE